MKSVIANVQTAIKAGLLPYWDTDPEAESSSGEIGPFLNVEAVLKNGEKNMDIKLETRKGDEEYNDVPLRLNWSKRLRNLKFTNTLKRLFDKKILSKYRIFSFLEIGFKKQHDLLTRKTTMTDCCCFFPISDPCIATSETIRTSDNVTYAYEPSSCWTLASAACGPSPVYAVFTKKASATPLAARVYIGGHLVEFNPQGQGNIEVSINGAAVSIEDQKETTHKEGSTEILKYVFNASQVVQSVKQSLPSILISANADTLFILSLILKTSLIFLRHSRIFRWGNTYNVYSFLKVWVAYDGNFVEVVPAPSTFGQHCGMCGNYNRNQGDEWTGKDMEQLDSAAKMVESWRWQC